MDVDCAEISSIPEVIVQSNISTIENETLTHINCEVVEENADKPKNIQDERPDMKQVKKDNILCSTKDFKQITANSCLNTNNSCTNVGNTYKELNTKLQKIKLQDIQIANQLSDQKETSQEDITPSAPVYKPVETIVEQSEIKTQSVKVQKPKVKCLPLEEAVRIFGGREIIEVKVLSDREEAAVESGPLSGPEHPLVDLLSTFRYFIQLS